MFFMQKEKNNMELLFSEMEKIQTRDFIFVYDDSLILSVKIEDFFDTDNGEELDSEFYEEYNAYVVKIKKIIVDVFDEYSGKTLFELNYKNFPLEIKTDDGRIVYHRRV